MHCGLPGGRDRPKVESDRTMTEFLVVYDYGQGGVWAIVRAESPADVRALFPELTLVTDRPSWMSDQEGEVTLVPADEDRRVPDPGRGGLSPGSRSWTGEPAAGEVVRYAVATFPRRVFLAEACWEARCFLAALTEAISASIRFMTGATSTCDARTTSPPSTLTFTACINALRYSSR